MKLANRIKMWKPRNAREQRRPITPSPHLAPASGELSQLDRFLALGTEGPTLFVRRSQFRIEELPKLGKAIEEEGVGVVHRIMDRVGANSNSNALVFALAMTASRGDDSARKAALDALPKVCPTGGELLAFLAAVDSERGWGRGLRNAIAKWYVDAVPVQLEREIDLLVDGWTHRDALRLAHPKPVSESQADLFGRLSDKSVRHRDAEAAILTLESLDEELFKWLPTGHRIFIAVDSTPSMRNWKVSSSNLSAAEVAAALAHGIVRAEPDASIAAWGAIVAPVAVTKRTTMASLKKSFHGGDVGIPNPTIPIVFAANKKLLVDTFVIVTDNETTERKSTPAQALATYRERTGIDAKLVTIGLTSTGFSIADPDDSGMLDVVGFDASVPQAMREFVIAQTKVPSLSEE